MDDTTNIQRLKHVLVDVGCEVSRARVVWALKSSLSDEHVAQLAGWAELEFLMADYTALTDRSIPVLCKFPLTNLSVGHTAVSAKGILGVSWPNLRNLGISGIDFSEQSIVPLMQSQHLTVVNANGSRLGIEAVHQLARLPKMAVLEANDAEVSASEAVHISSSFPKTTFRLDDGIWLAGKPIRPHRGGR